MKNSIKNTNQSWFFTTSQRNFGLGQIWVYISSCKLFRSRHKNANFDPDSFQSHKNYITINSSKERLAMVVRWSIKSEVVKEQYNTNLTVDIHLKIRRHNSDNILTQTQQQSKAVTTPNTTKQSQIGQPIIISIIQPVYVIEIIIGYKISPRNYKEINLEVAVWCDWMQSPTKNSFNSA